MRAGVVLSLALALAAPAAAQDTDPAAARVARAPVSFEGLDDAPAEFAYPGIKEEPPFTLKLVAVADSPHVGTLLIHNAMTSWQMRDGPYPLRVGGLVIIAIVTGERGDVPDTVVVSVPPGFYAEPPFVVVPEGGDAEIRILQWPMG